MRNKRKLFGVVGVVLLAVGVTVFAQMKRPYHDGSVWNIAFINVKPGMDTAYLTYLTSDWKRNQEAMKKEGLILSYKVIVTESHGTNDWNLMLMTEFKDLASMEANQEKAEAVVQQVVGNDEKQMQGYRDRLAIREVVGSRLGREIILEPRH
jgi:hypothetical protein